MILLIITGVLRQSNTTSGCVLVFINIVDVDVRVLCHQSGQYAIRDGHQVRAGAVLTNTAIGHDSYCRALRQVLETMRHENHSSIRQVFSEAPVEDGPANLLVQGAERVVKQNLYSMLVPVSSGWLLESYNLAIAVHCPSK